MNWDAASFFERLTSTNLLALDHHFTFCRVSGLSGLEEILSSMQSSTAFVAVSDASDGYTEINNSPHTRHIKTVFFAMRHAINDQQARNDCFEVLRELFRQFMSVLNLEKTHLQEGCIFVDPRIRFTEMPQYFASGCACAYFQIGVDTYTDLRYNPSEWKS